MTAAAPAAASSSAPAAAPVARYNPYGDQPTLSVDAVLERCTQVYPVEVAEPAGLLPSVKLRPYQKQSLAFMIDIERSTDATLLGQRTHSSASTSIADRAHERIRGGFLCDEMGMGKTMVCISLVLANPPKPNATSKGTLIIVNNTLVQQWYDECKRYAPKLKVEKHYASSKMRSVSSLRAA